MSTDPKSSCNDVGGIETIDTMRAKLTEEQFRGYLIGNIIKYSARYLTGKGHAEKIQIYSSMLVELDATDEPTFP